MALGRGGLPKLPPGALAHIKYPIVVDNSALKKATGFEFQYDELQTVRAIFLDVRMREQAALIQRHVAEMADDVRRLDERAEALQRHIGQASRDIEQIRTSTDKIVGRTEKIAGVDLTETSELTDTGRPKPLAGQAGAS